MIILLGRASAIGILSIFLAVASAVAGDARRKIIIDQDALGPGGSNMQALLLAIQSPNVEVLGITIVSGDGWRDENVAHTLRLLELIGRPDIPVLAGATFPLVNSKEGTLRWEAAHGKLFYKGAWMDSYPPMPNVKRAPGHGPFEIPPLEEGAPTIKVGAGSAVDFMIRKVHEFPGEVSILSMGPSTNIALAVRMDDTFASLAKEVVIMGGSFSPKAANNDFALEYLYSPRLEFNFRWDPEATHILLTAPWRKLMQIPVDPTTKTLFTPELIKRATRTDSPVTRYVAHYAQGFPMWDELAVAVWLAPEIVTHHEAIAVDVDIDHGAGYGNTLSWAVGQGPGLGEQAVDVVFDIDLARFEKLLAETFNNPASTPQAPAP